VSETAATLGGELTELRGAEAADVAFEYGRTGDGFPNETAAQSLSEPGAFEAAVDGLDPSAEYEFRAVAEAGTAGDTGNAETFTTDAEPTVAVETGSAADVGETGATVEGELTGLQGADGADVAFEYGRAGGSLDRRVAAGQLAEPATFSATVDGLDPATDYEFRAVAEAGDVRDEGAVETFATDEEEPNAAPTVETIDAGGGLLRGYDVDWEVADPDGNLAEVSSELRNWFGGVDDQATDDVDGASASGTHELVGNYFSDTIRLTVTDEEGRETTVTEAL